MDDILMLEEERLIDESCRATLRPIELSDVDDVMVWATDEKVSCFCTFGTYTSREQVLDYIKYIAIPHPWLRAICINNQAIGAISVTPYSDRWRAELGYVLAFKYWGRGIVTRAVKMVTSTIFAEWPHLQRLEAIVFAENKASQRVLQKAGFQYEGIQRNYNLQKGNPREVLLFSLISPDQVWISSLNDLNLLHL